MSIFIDQLFILLLYYLVIADKLGTRFDMVYILCGLIVYGVAACFNTTRREKIEKAVCLVTPAVLLPFPLFAPLSALLLCSAIYKFSKQLIYCSAIVVLSLLPIFIHSNDYQLWQLFLWGVTILLSIYFGIHSKLLSAAHALVKQTRDDATEQNTALSERNKYLASNQENEIHIATLSERNRIAREIHDNVGHLLSRSILQLGAIMSIHKGEPLEGQLAGLKETLDNAMTNIRESVHDLHKESFDVKDAAQKLLSDLSDYTVEFQCDISMDADKEIKYAYLTILKEAITNIRKHSNATKVSVTMTELEDYYQMLITDNGNVQKSITNIDAGIGLTNMQDRIRSLNGIITFSNQNGFRIFASVPKKN